MSPIGAPAQMTDIEDEKWDRIHDEVVSGTSGDITPDYTQHRTAARKQWRYKDTFEVDVVV